MSSRSERLKRLPWRLRYYHAGRVASEMRRMAIKATHSHCRVEFLGPVYLGPGFHLVIPDRGTLIIGAGAQFRRGFVCEISGDGRVEIGAHCTFTSNALIQCSTSIEIGDHCDFGQSTLIVDGNHRFRDHDQLVSEQGYDFTPIRIGRGALITTKCTIIANVGERSVIGANSVVSRDIPPYCVAVGAPARVIDYFGPPESRPSGIGD